MTLYCAEAPRCECGSYELDTESSPYTDKEGFSGMKHERICEACGREWTDIPPGTKIEATEGEGPSGYSIWEDVV